MANGEHGSYEAANGAAQWQYVLSLGSVYRVRAGNKEEAQQALAESPGSENKRRPLKRAEEILIDRMCPMPPEESAIMERMSPSIGRVAFMGTENNWEEMTGWPLEASAPVAASVAMIDAYQEDEILKAS